MWLFLSNRPTFQLSSRTSMMILSPGSNGTRNDDLPINHENADNGVPILGNGPDSSFVVSLWSDHRVKNMEIYKIIHEIDLFRTKFLQMRVINTFQFCWILFFWHFWKDRLSCFFLNKPFLNFENEKCYHIVKCQF